MHPRAGRAVPRVSYTVADSFSAAACSRFALPMRESPRPLQRKRMKPDQPTLLSPPHPPPNDFRGEQEVAYSADPFGNWIYLDSSWLELTGHTAQESLSRPMADFVHPEDRARHLEAFQSLLRGEIYSSRHPARLLRNDGLPCWVEIFAYPTLDARGNIDGITGTIFDVT